MVTLLKRSAIVLFSFFVLLAIMQEAFGQTVGSVAEWSGTQWVQTTLVPRTNTAHTWTSAQTFSVAPTISTMTAGSIPFFGTAGLVSQDNSNLFWDNTNKRLGIITATPSHRLHISSTANNHLRLQRGTEAFTFSSFIGADRNWQFFKVSGNTATSLNTIFRFGSIGAVDADNAFWNGFQLQGHTVTEGASNRFPMMTIYMRSATSTDPTDYEVNFSMGNLGTLRGSVGFAAPNISGSIIRFGFGEAPGTNEVMRIQQNGNTGFGTATPAGALDVVSTTGAFIVPRMTTTQRDAMTAVNGSIIYNTTTNVFNFRENGVWVAKANL